MRWLGRSLLENCRAFSLSWPAAVQIYWNKRNCLHKERVQLLQDWFGTPTCRRDVMLKHSLAIICLTCTFSTRSQQITCIQFLCFCLFLTVGVICLIKHLGRSLTLRFLSITFRFVVAGSTFRNPLETLIVKTKEQWTLSNSKVCLKFQLQSLP